MAWVREQAARLEDPEGRRGVTDALDLPDATHTAGTDMSALADDRVDADPVPEE